MRRLIDANALLDYLRKDKHESEVIEAVKDAPTVDAVEVVRCKDCKAYDKEVGYCEAMGFTCEMDDFCSYGERKDNESSID